MKNQNSEIKKLEQQLNEARKIYDTAHKRYVELFDLTFNDRETFSKLPDEEKRLLNKQLNLTYDIKQDTILYCQVLEKRLELLKSESNND